jgi:hypothetical protein
LNDRARRFGRAIANNPCFSCFSNLDRSKATS